MASLPDGFVLDDQPQGLPRGFVLDAQPTPQDPIMQEQPLTVESQRAQALGVEPIEPPKDIGVKQQIRQMFEESPQVGLSAGELEEFTVAPELQGGTGLQDLKKGLAGLLIADDRELALALRELIPGAEILKSREGKPLIKMPSGGTFAINKPGFSGQDFSQFIARLAAFTPAGRITGIGAKQLVKGGLASAATEAGLQGVEASVGGEFSPGDVAMAGAFAPAGQFVGEKLISPAARAIGGAISPSAKETIEAGQKEGVEVITSDVLPPQMNIAKNIQQLGEKLGVLGTGGIRAQQQNARVEVLERIAQEFDLGVDAEPVLSSAVKSLSKGVAKAMEKGGMQKGEAAFRLTPFGPIPVGQVQKEIGSQITKERSLKRVANQQVLNKLSDYAATIENMTFKQADRVRSRILADIRAARGGDSLPTTAEAPLQAVKEALDKAMIGFGNRHDKGAVSLWLKGNRNFFETFGKARNSVLKQVIRDGDMKPETLGRIIRQGQTSDLRRLNSLLDDSGKKAVQTAILRDIMEESGSLGAGFNPDRFTNAMQKGPRQRAINMFFRGQDRKMIKGVERVLDATRRAQQAAASPPTGQLLVPVAAGGGIVADPLTTLFVGGTLAAATRGYESRIVRDSLLRLANTPKGSQAEQRILTKILPSLLSSAQSTRTQQE